MQIIGKNINATNTGAVWRRPSVWYCYTFEKEDSLNDNPAVLVIFLAFSDSIYFTRRKLVQIEQMDLWIT